MPPQMKAAFIAIAPGTDPTKHQSIITSEMLEMTTILVNNVDQAIEVAKQLADQGCGLIELCSGFGHSMTGKVADAVRGKATVGAVRFDFFPPFGKSSDEIFGG